MASNLDAGTNLQLRSMPHGIFNCKRLEIWLNALHNNTNRNTDYEEVYLLFMQSPKYLSLLNSSALCASDART
jgi:hypothetical protein